LHEAQWTALVREPLQNGGGVLFSQQLLTGYGPYLAVTAVQRQLHRETMIPTGRRLQTPSIQGMSDAFNPNDMILRFRERAEAVRRRGLPPVEGPERQMFMDAAKLDFQDYAMLGDAVATLEDGILRLEIDLRPQS